MWRTPGTSHAKPDRTGLSARCPSKKQGAPFYGPGRLVHDHRTTALLRDVGLVDASARETFNEKQRGCHDLDPVAIALCRRTSSPARDCTGNLGVIRRPAGPVMWITFKAAPEMRASKRGVVGLVAALRCRRAPIEGHSMQWHARRYAWHFMMRKNQTD